MGLSAAQARYLFISNRTKDLENNLMRISNRQLTLADRADEIATLQNQALNKTKLCFKADGINYSDFNYADLMGDSALTNGKLNLITTNNGSDSKVVLDKRYADAVRAAGIGSEGGAFSVQKYAQFLAKFKTPTSHANMTWNLVGNNQPLKLGSSIVTFNQSDRQAAINFRDTYGLDVFQDRIVHYDTIEHKESNPQYTKVATCQGYLDGRMPNFLNPQYISSVKYDKYSAASSSSSDNLTKRLAQVREFFTAKLCDYDDKSNAYVLKSNALSTLKDINKINNLINEFKNTYGQLYLNPTDNTPVLDGREFAVIKALNVALTETTQNECFNGTNLGYLVSGTMPPQYIITYEQTNIVTEPFNAKGVHKNAWYGNFNNLSPEVQDIINNWPNDYSYCPYYKTVYSTVQPNEADKATYNTYKTLFQNICDMGWTEDTDVYDSENFFAKLEDMTYLVNSLSVSNNKDFSQISMSENKNIETFYKNELDNIKKEEKKLEVKSVALQTELNALSTEEASVKAIIDGNVERTFSLFG